jgi:hypothetical protein
MRAKTRVLLLAAALAVPGTAMAQWSDNFDSYSIGSINGQGGWKGWDNVAAAAGIVTNNAFRSAPNSQQINGPADSVHTYNAVGGQWSYTAYQFIPAGLTTGNTYFILLNKYNDGGPYAWSVQLNFDLAAGTVVDDSTTPATPPVSLVRNAWVPIRADFDLTADTLSTYYNNTLVYSGTWKRGNATALNAFQAVDLYANNAGAVFYDDMALVQIPAPATAGALGAFALVATRRRRQA